MYNPMADDKIPGLMPIHSCWQLVVTLVTGWGPTFHLLPVLVSLQPGGPHRIGGVGVGFGVQQPPNFHQVTWSAGGAGDTNQSMTNYQVND